MNRLVVYPWKSIAVEDAKKKIDVMLAEHRSRIKALLAAVPLYTWENFVQPLDEMDEEEYQLWFPVCHLDSVAVPQDPAVCEKKRKVFTRCLTKLSQYGTWYGQHRGLYNAYRYLWDHRIELGLDGAQQASIDDTLRGFRLSGVDLPTEKKKRFKQINIRLSKLAKRFEDRVVDATSPEKGWSKHVKDVEVLAGVPRDVLEGMHAAADKKKLDGYLVTLGESTYIAILENAKNRDLRREVYEERISRATLRGYGAGKYNNLPVIEEILALRHEQAHILGFSNHAEVQLETKMAESTSQVMDFLNAIMEKALSAALREREELVAYAKTHDGIDVLEPWDIRYYLKQVREQKFSFSEELFSEYFPAQDVISGAFSIVERLYSISFTTRDGVELWHPDAKLVEVRDKSKNLCAGLHIDLYERPGEKNGGAWMNEAVLRFKRSDGEIQLPVGILIANFSAPTAGMPSLLPMSEVETIVHELGHNVQLLLTNQEVRGVTGIRGVPHDGVELASQFMENFCWCRESLDMMACHYKTGEKIPDELFKKVLASRTFGLGHQTVWLAARSLFDFRLHMEYNPATRDQVHKLYDEVCNSVYPILPFCYPWAPESFTHLFSGGYHAGYYGYLWANVLAADCFSAFLKEDGSIDWSVGGSFLNEILSRGGSRPFMESFIVFRDRKPSIEPLLRQYGFAE